MALFPLRRAPLSGEPIKRNSAALALLDKELAHIVLGSHREAHPHKGELVERHRASQGEKLHYGSPCAPVVARSEFAEIRRGERLCPEHFHLTWRTGLPLSVLGPSAHPLLFLEGLAFRLPEGHEPFVASRSIDQVIVHAVVQRVEDFSANNMPEVSALAYTIAVCRDDGLLAFPALQAS